MRKLFTSESVTEGHPDKLCDQVSDAVLDALLAQDPMSRVACETCATTGMVMVMGEITTTAKVDIPAIVRDVVLDIGYNDSSLCFDGNTCAVLTSIHAQSPDIAMGVDDALETRTQDANEIGADAIAHGSTGAGNDQIRFDMTFLVMAPGVEIITLTRDMALSRQEEIDYLNKHGFAADFTKLKYSYNVGLWGTSICGGEILDSAQGLPESAYLKHCTKEGSEQLRLTFEKGELKAVNDETFDAPIKAIQKVEEIGAAYGIGRDMHVGDTIIGIKGRVGFEAAAPMLIIGAHKFLEKYTLSKWQQYWKDQVANWYGMFLHESQYLEPVMRDIEAMLESSQRNVNGTAILELHPLCFSTVGVESKDDLVKNKFGEYGEMQKGWTAEDAKGFIKVTSTALRAYYSNHKDEKI